MSRPGTVLRLRLACALAVAAAANAQSPSTDAPPVAYASASELNSILAQVKQTAQSLDASLGKARVDRWKGDASFKSETQNTVESVRRNLQNALPEMLNQLSAAPEDIAATFKLYRNLNALYDIVGQIVDRAQDRGSKDDYQNLTNDLNSLQSERRILGERMQTLAASKEAELTRLRAQLKAAQAAAEPPPTPKKIIVDDTEPPKKPVKKKAPAKPATATPPAAPPKPAN